MAKAQFAGIGSWRLVAYTSEVDGKVSYPLGENATGLLVYDAQGYMAAQLAGSQRPVLSTEDYRRLIPAETDAAFKSYVAYFGTYEINTEKRAVIHHVQNSLLPNWAGTNLIRLFEFNGNRMTLLSEPMLRGGHKIVLTLEWERLG